MQQKKYRLLFLSLVTSQFIVSFNCIAAANLTVTSPRLLKNNELKNSKGKWLVEIKKKPKKSRRTIQFMQFNWKYFMQYTILYQQSVERIFLPYVLILIVARVVLYSLSYVLHYLSFVHRYLSFVPLYLRQKWTDNFFLIIVSRIQCMENPLNKCMKWKHTST